jgi:DNA processing protein
VKSRCLSPLDGDYPSRLRSLARPPATITVCGGSIEADTVVAIVGSREAHRDALRYAWKLAASLAREGVVIASGGAVGVDAAAHLGTLRASGRTWCVAGTGELHCYPDRHSRLFARIARGPGAMVWPFPPHLDARARAFHERNRILVALADAVVVVQAALRSGALSTASRARMLRKPLWVLPAPHWLGPGFEGSRKLLDEGARPLESSAALLATLGRTGPAEPFSAPTVEVDRNLVQALPTPFEAPLHLDEIAARAHLSAQAATAALLTLALENVVVEGPPGFFRRRDAR